MSKLCPTCKQTIKPRCRCHEFNPDATETEIVERVKKLSTHLLGVILTEFPGEVREANVLLIGILDTAIKAAKYCHLTKSNVESCDLLLLTLRTIRQAEVVESAKNSG